MRLSQVACDCRELEHFLRRVVRTVFRAFADGDIRSIATRRSATRTPSARCSRRIPIAQDLREDDLDSARWRIPIGRRQRVGQRVAEFDRMHGLGCVSIVVERHEREELPWASHRQVRGENGHRPSSTAPIRVLTDTRPCPLADPLDVDAAGVNDISRSERRATLQRRGCAKELVSKRDDRESTPLASHDKARREAMRQWDGVPATLDYLCAACGHRDELLSNPPARMRARPNAGAEPARKRSRSSRRAVMALPRCSLTSATSSRSSPRVIRP